jgi:hypothetical protein
VVTSEGGSILANTTFNKGHVLIIKWKKTLKPMLSGDYAQ